MLTIPEDFNWSKDWKTVEFTDNLEIVGIERGRSAAHFLARSMEDGTVYTIFMVDLLAMLDEVKDKTITGTFVVVKRGMDLGICLKGKRIHIQPATQRWDSNKRKIPSYTR